MDSGFHFFRYRKAPSIYGQASFLTQNRDARPTGGAKGESLGQYIFIFFIFYIELVTVAHTPTPFGVIRLGPNQVLDYSFFL